MKLHARFSWLLSLLTALSVALPVAKAVPAAVVAAREMLYVTIAIADPVAFAQHRYALTTGAELYLATLRQKAAEEARAAKFDGTVIVLDEGASPPAGANVLRLTWSVSGVVAEYFDGARRTSKTFGDVSATPVRFHPNFNSMQGDLFQASRDGRSDATVRARAQMDLFLALARVADEVRAKQTA